MKNIGKLLQQIERFASLAEEELATIGAEHAVDRAKERVENQRLADLSNEIILKKMYDIMRNKAIFDKIPENSKWTLEGFEGTKAVIQKIQQAGHWKLILKTILKPGYRESGIIGPLEDFANSILFETKREEINEKKRTINALKRLLEKKLPITVEQLKANNPPEYWKKFPGLFPLLRGGPITQPIVQAYKDFTERELKVIMDSLNTK